MADRTVSTLAEGSTGRNLDYLYDQYLLAHEREVVEAIGSFQSRLEKSLVKFGRFTIPTFYKPHLLSPKQEHILKRVNSALMEIVNTATRLYFEEPHLRHYFQVSPEAKSLIEIDPGYPRNVIFARFDAFLEGEGFKVIELNCDSPAGAGYADILEEMLFGEDLLKSFFSEYAVKREYRRERVLAALLEVWEEFGGYETPNIAIVDWHTVRTRPEFESFKEFFESKGYKTTIADPRELTYKGGKLYHKNFKINLIYRRVIFDELLQRLDEVKDFIRAYQEKAVCVVNPLRSRLGSSKSLLSILTNPEYDRFFTEEENRIKRDYLLWTRRMIDADKFYGGKKIYLVDFLKDEKESLVLKPSTGYGGKGVWIGRETKDETWNEAIDKALKGDYVVQEFGSIPIIAVPTVVNRKLDFAYKKVNLNCLVFGSKLAGNFSRLSDESVVNVARGGGLIPTVAGEIEPDR
ncbi:MAG: glutathionylspermidine synthase family protein [Candidatus Omnitrophica bacterium]|nr:glutathionylspermidine synthase family protein [Candidatus Omnitrophota bacterium]